MGNRMVSTLPGTFLAVFWGWFQWLELRTTLSHSSIKRHWEHSTRGLEVRDKSTLKQINTHTGELIFYDLWGRKNNMNDAEIFLWWALNFFVLGLPEYVVNGGIGHKTCTPRCRAPRLEVMLKKICLGWKQLAPLVESYVESSLSEVSSLGGCLNDLERYPNFRKLF